MGYGSRCLELLKNYYEGKVINLQENEETTPKTTKNEEVAVCFFFSFFSLFLFSFFINCFFFFFQFLFYLFYLGFK